MPGPKKYVICGAPCSGKTTLVNRLSKKGFLTVAEAARMIIDKGIDEGMTVKEVRKNHLDFQRKIFSLKIEQEARIPENKVTFLDTGMPNSMAYYRLHGLDVNEILDACKKTKYQKVFLLELLDYKKDYARLEDKELAEKIARLVSEAYEETGHETIFVPKMPIEDRVNFILSNL